MSTPEPRTTAPEDRVPWNQLIAYGMGGLIPIALFNIAPQLMSLLGNISLGLSAVWLGTIMMIPRLWDAFSDPIMGHISDNTRTRWGRRRPYILLGGIAVALSFVAMWWIPSGEWIRSIFPGETAYNRFQLACILGGLLIFFTATTIFEIPHGALGMEMSSDYHERTRLFSAKSFLGNLFAMGTPWLYALASLEFFRGVGGNLADGMRYVSLFVAILLLPMAFWWFFQLREPGFVVVRQQQKSSFWQNMRTTVSNKTFLVLVAIIFTLAMGFNFVQIFNNYIAIFYVYGGDVLSAGKLLGWVGMAWAITGLVAVFPLNVLSQKFGKSRTLLFAILIMCVAQLSKIVCYNPEFPFLLFIPAILLSAGMLMFFTLGASMVGDICDEDELETGTRNEGSYYSVYWWFIKLGGAFAGFVMGALLVTTGFDERQNVTVDDLLGNLRRTKSEVQSWQLQDLNANDRIVKFQEQIDVAIKQAETVREHFAERMQIPRQQEGDNNWFTERLAKTWRRLNEWMRRSPDQLRHISMLEERADSVRSQTVALKSGAVDFVENPVEMARELDALLEQTALLKRQTPTTLFRLRFVEIGLPLLLSAVSIGLTLRYPLTEARCYEIKQALQARHAQQLA
jgi:GPH family glycoside/pentoside/hexuronide:cation symporter